MFKLSFSDIAWTAENDAQMYRFLQDTGFSGLEIAPTRIFPEAPYYRLEEAGEWAEGLRRDFGLEIPSMQSIWYGRQERVFGSEAERRALVEYTRKAIDFAQAICCPNLVFGNPRSRDTEDVERDYPLALEFFREIGAYAAEHGTVIAIEANPVIYRTRFINTTREALQLARDCACEGVKVNIDLGTIIYNKEDLDCLKEAPELINHVHISEPGLKPVRCRKIHGRLLAILEEIGYRRYVSVEMGNTGDISEVQRIAREIAKLSQGIC